MAPAVRGFFLFLNLLARKFYALIPKVLSFGPYWVVFERAGLRRKANQCL